MDRRMIDTVFACQMAYRKHCLNDESVGWDQLSDILKESLCNAMGDDGFLIWLDHLWQTNVID